MKRLIVILLFVAALFTRVVAQVVVMPDSLFVHSTSDTDNNRLLRGVELGDNVQLFKEAPAVTLEDYVTTPYYHETHFHYMPDYVSEFYVHVMLLHLSKIEILGLDAQLAQYSVMLDNFHHNLLQGGSYDIPYVPAIYGETHSGFVTGGGGGAGVVFSGTLDPFEAYNRWMQERRLMRARKIIRELEQIAPIKEEVNATKIALPANLLEETNYDVKVKQAGNNPPYRP